MRRTKSTRSNRSVNSGISLDEIPKCIELSEGYGVKVITIPDENGAKEAMPERQFWIKDYDFILAALGYSVGLGNLWRFPYKVYQYGGGTFLIPYFFVLIVMGVPMFFVELVLGQYVGYGPIKIFGRMAPLFRGLGFSMAAVTCYLAIYYNMINVWSIYYLFSTFADPLPWEGNGDQTETFFTSDVLGLDVKTHTWYNFGTLQWKVVLCCLATWIIIFLVSWKGIQKSRIVIIIAVIFPFLFLLVLLIIGFTLPGSSDGIKQFFKIEPRRLINPMVSWSTKILFRE